jgi:transposase
MARRKQRVRRFWPDEEKRRIVAQALVPGVSVAQVARRYDLNANQVFNWLTILASSRTTTR